MIGFCEVWGKILWSGYIGDRSVLESSFDFLNYESCGPLVIIFDAFKQLNQFFVSPGFFA